MITKKGNMDNDNDIKTEYDPKYLCPITNELMKILVIAYDGHAYEREAIIKYVRKHHTTPKQNSSEKLSSQKEVEQVIASLFPYYALKREINRLNQ